MYVVVVIVDVVVVLYAIATTDDVLLLLSLKHTASLVEETRDDMRMQGLP